MTAVPPAGEATARLTWVGLIVGLLAMNILMCAVAATLAVGDPSFAVVPGYHEQALRWDETVAARQASRELGWKAAIVPSAEADVLGRRSISISMADRDGQPLAGATVRAELFHHTRPTEVRAVTFTEATSGRYQAVVEMRRAGLWQVWLDVERHEDRYSEDRQIELPTQGTR